jgi:type I restriction enzyme S subunit
MDAWTSMRLPIPPLDEQTAIIAFLNQETTRAIALLKERRSALISAAVTGKIDVREPA